MTRGQRVQISRTDLMPMVITSGRALRGGRGSDIRVSPRGACLGWAQSVQAPPAAVLAQSACLRACGPAAWDGRKMPLEMKRNACAEHAGGWRPGRGRSPWCRGPLTRPAGGGMSRASGAWHRPAPVMHKLVHQLAQHGSQRLRGHQLVAGLRGRRRPTPPTLEQAVAEHARGSASVPVMAPIGTSTSLWSYASPATHCMRRPAKPRTASCQESPHLHQCCQDDGDVALAGVDVFLQRDGAVVARMLGSAETPLGLSQRPTESDSGGCEQQGGKLRYAATHGCPDLAAAICSHLPFRAESRQDAAALLAHHVTTPHPTPPPPPSSSSKSTTHTYTCLPAGRGRS